MFMNYHIGRLVLSSLCVGAFVAAGIWWCSFCRLQPVYVVILSFFGSSDTFFFFFIKTVQKYTSKYKLSHLKVKSYQNNVLPVVCVALMTSPVLQCG